MGMVAEMMTIAMARDTETEFGNLGFKAEDLS
jgi:hypothetical protein